MSVSAWDDASGEEQSPPSVSVPELVEAIIANLDAEADLAPASLDRLSGLMRRFATYASRAHGIRSLDEVETDHLRRFLEAHTPSGSAPSIATMHLRRSAVRLLFREAAEGGAVSE